MDDPGDFKTLRAALKWLQDQGYKIAKSKIYEDRERGLIPVREDGSVSARDVAAYAVTLRKQPQGRGRADVVEDLAERKLRAEIEKTEEQAAKIRHERAIAEGKYILKAEAEAARVDLLVLVDGNIRALCERRAPHWVRLAGGDGAKIPDVRNSISADIDDLFDSLARSDAFVIDYGDGNGASEAAT